MSDETIINKNITAHCAFFEEMASGFAAIDEIFERMATKTEYLVENCGGLGEDDSADEAANAQLAQLRILARDFNGFMADFVDSIGALRDKLTTKIEFGKAMLEAME